MRHTNYIEELRSEIVKELPGLPDQLIDLYTLIGKKFGAFVNNEDVHDAWSIWQNTIDPKHISLIPFAELSPEKQELDTKYARGIAKAWITVNNKEDV